MKLYNDDCLKVLKEIPDSSIDLVITDLPYFVLPKGKNEDKFEWDNFESVEAFLEFTSQWFTECKRILKNDSFMFIFWSQKYLKEGFNLFDPARLIFWNYVNLVMGGNGDFAYDYEPVFVVKKGNPKLVEGKHNCVLRYTKPQSNFNSDKLVHPCQKSLSLLEHLVSISSKEDDVVLDCFMGSGTTGAACMKMGRDFIGIEQNPGYFEITKTRIESMKREAQAALF